MRAMYSWSCTRGRGHFDHPSLLMARIEKMDRFYGDREYTRDV